MDRQVESMLRVSLQNIKEMIDVDTVVGKPINQMDGTTIIPISHVKMGFASGGSDFKVNAKMDNPFGGATGGSVSINPIAFLVVKDTEVKVMHLQSDTHLYEKILDKIPNFYREEEI